MYHEHFDTLARWAVSSLTRRRSLAALGSAALTATVTTPLTAARRKKRKKCRKKIKRTIRRTCGQQVGECEAGFLATGDPDLVPCCNLLATCDFTAFFECAS